MLSGSRCHLAAAALLLSACWQSVEVAAQITSVQLSAAGFYTGGSPAGLKVQFIPTNAINTGGTIVITASAAIFATDTATATAPTLGGTGVTAGTPAAAITGTSTVYTVTMASGGQATAGNDATVTIPATALQSTNSVAAGTVVTLTVTSTGNVNSAGNAAFEVIGVPTVTWSGSATATQTPTEMQVSMTAPFDILTGSSIRIESDKAIFDTSLSSTAASGLSSVLLSNIDSSSLVSYVATNIIQIFVQGSAIFRGTTVGIVLRPSVLTTIPSSAGDASLTVYWWYEMFNTATVPGITGWLNILTATPNSQISISPASITVSVATPVSFTGSRPGDVFSWSAAGDADCSTTTPGTTISSTNEVVSVTLAFIGQYRLCYRLNGLADSVMQINGDMTANAAGAVVSGDPVTWFGNRRAEFELPLGKLTPLLKMPDLELHAAPFEGSQKEQWIGRTVIKSPITGEVIVQIDVNQDMRGFDRSAMKHDGRFALETMTLLLGHHTNVPYDRQFVHTNGTWGLFGKLDCKYDRFIPCREAVTIIGRFAKVVISSNSAREWYGEGEQAVAHTHLDFDVFDMTAGVEAIGGPLPEMWGMKTLTKETRALLKGDPVEVDPGRVDDSTSRSVCREEVANAAV